MQNSKLIILLGGVVFYGDFAQGNISAAEVKYAIRLSNVARNSLIAKSDNGRKSFGIDQTWDTKLTYPMMQLPGPREKFDASGGKPGYWRETFLTLQRAIDTAITVALEPEAGEVLGPASLVTPIPSLLVELKRFPYPSYVDNPFILAMQRNFSLILMISLSLSVLYITRNVVREKQQRLKVKV